MRTALIRSLLAVLALLLAGLAGMSVRAVVEDDASEQAAVRPVIGRDHWHAVYEVYICGTRQPPFPLWEAGVHTHEDGVIHIHPFIPDEEGRGARLVKWFEYGGGKLTQDEMRLPGTRQTVRNGDECPDGSEGFVQVFVNGRPLDDWSQYISQDGDRVGIVFGPR